MDSLGERTLSLCYSQEAEPTSHFPCWIVIHYQHKLLPQHIWKQSDNTRLVASSPKVHYPEISQKSRSPSSSECEPSPESSRFKRTSSVKFGNVSQAQKFSQLKGTLLDIRQREWIWPRNTWEHQRCIIQKLARKVVVLPVINPQDSKGCYRWISEMWVWPRYP